MSAEMKMRMVSISGSEEVTEAIKAMVESKTIEEYGESINNLIEVTDAETFEKLEGPIKAKLRSLEPTEEQISMLVAMATTKLAETTGSLEQLSRANDKLQDINNLDIFDNKD